MDAKPGLTKISVVVTTGTPIPPPVGANFFHFSVVGTEVQFLVGSLNLLDFQALKEVPQVDPSVTPMVTHRFSLSPFGFAQLQAAVNGIASKVPPPGVEIKAGAD